VLQSPRFNNYLDKISTDKNDRDKKTFEALEILSEMGFDRSLMVIRALGSIIDKLMAQLYDAVNVNEKSVEELKNSMGHQQVIYLPSHRSYVDFMLMSYICFSYNLEIPCIAAGMDFHGMMVLMHYFITLPSFTIVFLGIGRATEKNWSIFYAPNIW
jgi:glyceronephosphate O-acyltransferase